MSWNRELFPPMRAEAHYGDRMVDCFIDRPKNLWRLLADAADRYPESEALVSGERRLNWHELADAVDAAAAALAANGICSGDRITMVMGNSADFVVALFAIFRVGAVAVPVSTRSSRLEVAYATTNCSSKLVLYDLWLSDIVPPAANLPDCEAVAFSQLSGEGSLPTADELPDEEEVALVLHTSGTTGKPKGATLTHLALIHAAMFYEAAMRLSSSDRIVASVPLNHVTGIAALIAAPMRAGATLILMEEFRAQPFLDLAEAERMTYTLMVPAMYNLCLMQPDFGSRRLEAWRLAAYGGAPMPEPTIRRLAEAIPDLRFANCYGSTESIVAQLITPPEHAYDKRDFVGCPLPGTETRIMDENGHEVPAGTEGEIWLKGPNVVSGYWNEPEKTAHAFVAGFWRSGDIGMMDEDGFVKVLDRAKDMINRGGHKIYSAELESALTDHPAVIEAAAIAKPCPVLGERVHAVVVVRATVAVEELQAWCRERLSDYKIPETLDLSRDPLPRIANGKIDKKTMRADLLDAIEAG